MVHCAVLGCKSNSEKKIDGVSFHSFPKDTDLFHKWIAATGRDNSWTPTKYSKICSNHFASNVIIKKNKNAFVYENSIPLANMLENGVSEPAVMSVQPECNTVVCRTCIAECKDFRTCSLFKPWKVSWEGMGKNIAEDIKNLTHIQIEENDGLSQVICLECLSKFRKMFMFITFVRKNDKCMRLKVFGVNDWPKPISVENSVDITVKQEIISEDEESTTPWLEAYSINNADIKLEPEDSDDRQSVNNVDMDIDKLDDNDEEYDINGLTSPDMLLVPIKDEPVEEDEPISDVPLNCLLCLKIFNSISGLKAHVISQHSYKTVNNDTRRSRRVLKRITYSCSVCHEMFKTSTDLMVHESSHNKTKCFTCHKQFNSFLQLSIHSKRCGDRKRTRSPIITLDDVRRLQTIDQQQTIDNTEEEYSHMEIERNRQEENQENIIKLEDTSNSIHKIKIDKIESLNNSEELKMQDIDKTDLDESQSETHNELKIEDIYSLKYESELTEMIKKEDSIKLQSKFIDVKETTRCIDNEEDKNIDNVLKKEEVNKIKPTDKLKTLDDGNRFENERTQIKNLENEESISYKCPNCDESFSDEFYLVIHREIHLDDTAKENAVLNCETLANDIFETLS